MAVRHCQYEIVTRRHIGNGEFSQLPLRRLPRSERVPSTLKIDGYGSLAATLPLADQQRGELVGEERLTLPFTVKLMAALRAVTVTTANRWLLPLAQ